MSKFYRGYSAQSLSDDEVNFELRIRNAFNQQDSYQRRRRALDKILDTEKNMSQLPNFQNILDNSDAPHEIQKAKAMINALRASINTENNLVWKHKIMHTCNRLAYIAKAIPASANQIQLLQAEIPILIEEYKALRNDYSVEAESSGGNAAHNHTQQTNSSATHTNTMGATIHTANGTSTPISTAPPTNHSIAPPTYNPAPLPTNVATVPSNAAPANTTAGGQMSINDFFSYHNRSAPLPPAAHTHTPSPFVTNAQLNTAVESILQSMHTLLREHLTPAATRASHQQTMHADQSAAQNTLPANVTLVPYMHTPVGKWPFKFSGLPHAKDNRSIENVCDFFDLIEERMGAHKVSHLEMASQINLLFEGPARRFFTETRQQGIESYIGIKIAFLKRFANVTEDNVRHEIYTKKQKSDERTLDFVYDMCDIIRRLPCHIHEKERLEMIYRGIDTEVAKLARARGVETIDELATYIIDTFGCHHTPVGLTATSKSRPQHYRFDYKRLNAIETTDGMLDESVYDEKEISAISRFVDNFHKKSPRQDFSSNTQNKPTQVCWNCDMAGHNIQTCYKPISGPLCLKCGCKDIDDNVCTKCKNVQCIPSPKNTNIAPTSELQAVYDVHNLIYVPINDVRPHTEVKFDHIESEALLDTGAHATVIGMNHLTSDEQAHVRKVLLHLSVGIRTADNQIHRALGAFDSTHEYNGRKQVVRTIVMAVASKRLLLGMDFMSAFGIRLVDWHHITNLVAESTVSAKPINMAAITLAAIDSGEVVEIPTTETPVIESTQSANEVTLCVNCSRRVYGCEDYSKIRLIAPKPPPRLTAKPKSRNKEVNANHGRTLCWKFLLYLLRTPGYEHVIDWVAEQTFVLKDAQQVADLYGQQNGKATLRAEDLHRTLRFYYQKGVLKKSGQKGGYTFIRPVKELWDECDE